MKQTGKFAEYTRLREQSVLRWELGQRAYGELVAENFPAPRWRFLNIIRRFYVHQ